jgi:hypothetical protein
VRRQAKRFYDAVGWHLGKDDTAALFQRFSPAVKERGKRANKEKNARLLQLYDEKTGLGATVPEAAASLFSEYNTELGASADAIEQQIYRLLRGRERQRRDRAKQEEARHKAFLEDYRRQFGKEPTTLLGEASPSQDPDI